MRKSFYLLCLLLLPFTNQLAAQVVINEFSAANYSHFLDNYNRYQDWIELYNTSPVPVDLSGYYLSDRINNNTKWQIPEGTVIPGNGHLVFICDGRNEAGGGWYHTNFRLTQCQQEPIVFSSPAGVIIDSVTDYSPNQTNHSRGRVTDGGAAWTLFVNPTPGQTNNNVQPYNEYPARPLLSMDAGFYNGPITVSISSPTPNTTIHYTLNGFEPTAASPVYNGPITIDQTTVVRAIALSSLPNTPPGFIETNSYFINENHVVPVISISGTQLLILMGGQQIEPVGHMEYFDANGVLRDEALGEYNKHGNDSWAYQQRGIDYITRDQFGYKHAIEHKIFRGKNRNSFQRFMMKAGANDNYPFANGAHIRDAYLQSLSQVAGMEMDERSHESCVMYVNGQYWGVYDVREKVDDHDFTDHYYNQDRWNIDFLKTWGGTWAEYGSNVDWVSLRNFIMNNDMEDPGNYAIVEEQLETLSLIDYFILNAYAVCSDWLNWNTGWWKGNNPQGQARKWRYILWDLDASFGHYINYTGIPDQSAAANICFPEFLNNPGGQGHVPIWNKLLTNETFFAKYINRMSDMSNTYYSCEFLHHHLDSLVAIFEPEMPRQIDRWGGNIAAWQANVQVIHDFIEERCNYINNNILGCYDDLEGPYNLTVNVSPAGSGKVKVNTINPTSFPFSGTYFGGINQTLKATANPGFVFSHWTAAGIALDPSAQVDEVQFSLIADQEVTAHFVPAFYYPVTFMVEPSGAGRININNEYLNQYPSVKELAAIVSNPMFAVNNPGYAFDRWEVSLPNQLAQPLTESINNLQVNFQGTVKAIFTEKIYDITFDVSPRGYGTIDLNGATIPVYPETRSIWGDQISELKAKTDVPFYVFERWDMNQHVPEPAFEEPEVQVEFSAHDEVVAVFREVPNYAITFVTVPKEKGKIRFGDQVITEFPYTARYEGGTAHMLEAIPAFKWQFVKWDFRNRPMLAGHSPMMQYTIVRDDTIVLHIEERFSELFIPNSFTPNGDGVNELWKVVGTEVLEKEFRVSIYDRWGVLVYESTDIHQGWNGSHMNNGYYCPTGIYAYVLKYRNAITNKAHDESGSITLIR